MTAVAHSPARSVESLTHKVAKLLNQAEKAGTEAEAATFLAKAQELAALYSIDLARAQHATMAKERTTPVQRTITVGVAGTRGLSTLVSLFGGIARANDLEVDVASNSTKIYAYGFAEDIDIAEALFASLSVQMSHAVEAYRRDGSWKDTATFVPGGFRLGRWVDDHFVSANWMSVRLDFQQGFAHRISQRLARARRDAEDCARRCDEQQPGETAGTDLVLVTKREAVTRHYKDHSTARGKYRNGRKINNRAAREAGSRAGDHAQLSRSGELAGPRGELE